MLSKQYQNNIKDSGHACSTLNCTARTEALTVGMMMAWVIMGLRSRVYRHKTSSTTCTRPVQALAPGTAVPNHVERTNLIS